MPIETPATASEFFANYQARIEMIQKLAEHKLKTTEIHGATLKSEFENLIKHILEVLDETRKSANKLGLSVADDIKSRLGELIKEIEINQAKHASIHPQIQEAYQQLLGALFSLNQSRAALATLPVSSTTETTLKTLEEKAKQLNAAIAACDLATLSSLLTAEADEFLSESTDLALETPLEHAFRLYEECTTPATKAQYVEIIATLLEQRSVINHSLLEASLETILNAEETKTTHPQILSLLLGHPFEYAAADVFKLFGHMGNWSGKVDPEYRAKSAAKAPLLAKIEEAKAKNFKLTDRVKYDALKEELEKFKKTESKYGISLEIADPKRILSLKLMLSLKALRHVYRKTAYETSEETGEIKLQSDEELFALFHALKEQFIHEIEALKSYKLFELVKRSPAAEKEKLLKALQKSLLLYVEKHGSMLIYTGHSGKDAHATYSYLEFDPRDRSYRWTIHNYGYKADKRNKIIASTADSRITLCRARSLLFTESEIGAYLSALLPRLTSHCPDEASINIFYDTLYDAKESELSKNQDEDTERKNPFIPVQSVENCTIYGINGFAHSKLNEELHQKIIFLQTEKLLRLERSHLPAPSTAKMSVLSLTKVELPSSFKALKAAVALAQPQTKTRFFLKDSDDPSLEELISLSWDESISLKEKEDAEALSITRPHQADLKSLVKELKQSRWIITASSGMGKSTLSKLIFSHCSTAFPTKHILYLEADKLQLSEGTLDALATEIQRIYPSTHPPHWYRQELLKLLASTEVIIIIDAYDIATEAQRKFIDLILAHINNWALMTRTSTQPNAISLKAKVARLNPLDSIQSKKLIHAYFGSGLMRNGVLLLAKDFIERVEPSLLSGQTPMNILLMCGIFYRSGMESFNFRTQAALYNEVCFQATRYHLQRCGIAGPLLSIPQARRLAQPQLALFSSTAWSIINNPSQSIIKLTDSSLVEFPDEPDIAKSAADFPFWDAEKHSFIHQSFIDYFAAQHWLKLFLSAAKLNRDSAISWLNKNRFNTQALMILRCISQSIPKERLDEYFTLLTETSSNAGRDPVLSIASFKLIGTLLSELSTEAMAQEKIELLYKLWKYSLKHYAMTNESFKIESLYFSNNKLIAERLISELSSENTRNKVLFLCETIRLFGFINLAAAEALRNRIIPADKKKGENEWVWILQSLLEIDLSLCEQAIKDNLARSLVLWDGDYAVCKGKELYIGPIISQLNNEYTDQKFYERISDNFKKWFMDSGILATAERFEKLKDINTGMVSISTVYFNYLSVKKVRDDEGSIPSDFVDPIFFLVSRDPTHKEHLSSLIQLLAAQIPGSQAAALRVLFKLYRMESVKPLILEILREILSAPPKKASHPLLNGRNFEVAAAAIAVHELNLHAEFSDLICKKKSELKILDKPLFAALLGKLNPPEDDLKEIVEHEVSECLDCKPHCLAELSSEIKEAQALIETSFINKMRVLISDPKSTTAYTYLSNFNYILVHCVTEAAIIQIMGLMFEYFSSHFDKQNKGYFAEINELLQLVLNIPENTNPTYLEQHKALLVKIHDYLFSIDTPGDSFLSIKTHSRPQDLEEKILVAYRKIYASLSYIDIHLKSSPIRLTIPSEGGLVQRAFKKLIKGNKTKNPLTPPEFPLKSAPIAEDKGMDARTAVIRETDATKAITYTLSPGVAKRFDPRMLAVLRSYRDTSMRGQKGQILSSEEELQEIIKSRVLMPLSIARDDSASASEDEIIDSPTSSESSHTKTSPSA